MAARSGVDQGLRRPRVKTPTAMPSPAPPLPPLPANPLISVVVPSYNQGAFIRQTIESCLAQDYRPFEIIVMDGASTDNTVQVLQSFGQRPELQWVSEKDDGVVDAVNKGLRRARGEICAIQSSDDYYLPGAFSHAAATFARQPAAGLVFGNVDRVDVAGQLLFSPRQPAYSLARLLAREVFVYQAAAFFRRDLALQLGGWNPRIPHVPDTDLWYRLAFHAEVVQLRSALAACRTHPGQRDTHLVAIYDEYLQMLAESRELVTAPRVLRRAAAAGAALLKFRYGGPWSDAELTRAAWRALCYRPSLLWSPALPKHRLLPGYFALTRLRRRLLGRPP
ncbi:MAG: Chondroitin synthase [Verrucomicrobia bacterium ADurb.Bin018]|nr:MAG: Chondroitin synthase [Verrucomicrobia bacterium ADurb.Bin018]